MTQIASLFKAQRIAKKLKLAEAAAILNLDNAILSKIERGERLATRKQLKDFILFYALDEKNATIHWLSEKILYELADEQYALEALYAAEESLKANTDSAQKPEEDTKEWQAYIEKIDHLKAKCISKKTIENDVWQTIHQQQKIQNTFESNRMAGYDFSLEETQQIIENGMTISGKSMQAHMAVMNHFDALEFLENAVNNNVAFTDQFLKEIHYTLLKGINRNEAGHYRKLSKDKIARFVKPPEPNVIAKKIEEIVTEYNQSKMHLHPILLAANVHEKLFAIQAFSEANGRVARLVMNFILLQNNYEIIAIKSDYTAKKEYHTALEIAQNRQVYKGLHVLISQYVAESLKHFINTTANDRQ